MKTTRLAALALVSAIALGCSAFAQEAPGAPANPATEGTGSSAQHVDAAGGAVAAGVDSSGSTSAAAEDGASVQGQVGVSVNGMGVTLGGDAGVSASGQTEEERAPGTPAGSPVAGGPAGATPAIPGAGRAMACTDAELGDLGHVAPERILGVDRTDGISVVPICESSSSLTADERQAIEANPAITAALAAGGWGSEQVIALELGEAGPLTLYVLGGGSN